MNPLRLLPVIFVFTIAGCEQRPKFQQPVVDHSWMSGKLTIEPKQEGKELGFHIGGAWPNANDDLQIRYAVSLSQKGEKKTLIANAGKTLAKFAAHGDGAWYHELLANEIEINQPHRLMVDFEIWKGKPGSGTMLCKDSLSSEEIKPQTDQSDASD